MRSIVRWLVPAAIVGSFLVMWCVHKSQGLAAERHTPVTLTRIYTGQDGLTHAEDVDVKLTPVAGRLAKWLEHSETVKVTNFRFSRMSPGLINDWHPAAERGYVITLSGQVEFELAGGRKVLEEPGGILQAEDVTGKGHVTRVVGSADWVGVVVQFADR